MLPSVQSLWIIAWLLFAVAQRTMPPAAPEDCTNAVDDDGDGLIDLNDPDCICQVIKPESLIPNPSFEDHTCCPSNRGQLECAVTWIQASEATTDYLHTCGWFGWPNIPVPRPIPDGEACIGFRNGRYLNNIEPNWKEYTGACLSSPLRKGTTYTFRFYIGFSNSTISPPTNVVFYGTPDCDYLPFGLGDPGHGCPLNGPGWQELGSVYLNATNTWVRTDITIIPRQDIYAVAIGPDCAPISASSDIYYFFDNLILADQKSFEFQIMASKHPCASDFSLELPAYDSLSYQWYLNGIALVGETSPTLDHLYGDGNYQARITSSLDCRVTEPYSFIKPVFTGHSKQWICAKDSYAFGDRKLAESGIYVDTFATRDGCDSIVELTLSVIDFPIDSVVARIFDDETYVLGPHRIKEPVRSIFSLSSKQGCDSLVYLDLSYYHVFIPNVFSPNGDGTNDYFTIRGTADLEELVDFKVFNRWGNILFDQQHLDPQEGLNGWDGTHHGQPMPPDVYTYQVLLKMDDGKLRERSGSVTLIR